MINGLCKLCGEEKPLIKSHVIPQQFFTQPKKRLVTVHKDKTYISSCPVGFYDKSILCQACDGKLGVFDQEAQTLLLSDLRLYRRDKAYIIPSTKFNYSRLKLFFVSLIWRASVSTMVYFKDVNLGEFEKEALGILRNPELDREDLFPVLIFKLTDAQDIQMRGIYIDPVPCRLKDINMYMFVFGGYHIQIKVDSRELDIPFPFLKPNQDLLMLEKSPIEELSFMANISSSHGSDNRFVKRINQILQILKTEENL